MWYHKKFVGVLIILFVALSQVNGAVEYTVTDLGVPAGYVSFKPYDISDSGQVVGMAYDNAPGDMDEYLSRAFVWSNGGFTELPPLSGYRSSEAVEINSSGQVVGRTYLVNEQSPGSRTVVWSGGVPADVGPSHDEGRIAHELGINDHGDIVASGVGQAGYLLKDGQSTNLGIKPTGINNSCQIVGHLWTAEDNSWRAYLWQEQTGKVKLDDITGTNTLATASAINNQGQIIGREWFRENPEDELLDQAYLYDPSGEVTRLGTLGGSFSRPYSINEQGQIVGYAETDEHLYQIPSFPLAEHAFIYDALLGMRDLNALIAPDSGWELKGAFAINNNGHIIGWDLNNRAFLLQPIPEPATLLLLGLGGLMLKRGKI